MEAQMCERRPPGCDVYLQNAFPVSELLGENISTFQWSSPVPSPWSGKPGNGLNPQAHQNWDLISSPNLTPQRSPHQYTLELLLKELKCPRIEY